MRDDVIGDNGGKRGQNGDGDGDGGSCTRT